MNRGTPGVREDCDFKRHVTISHYKGTNFMLVKMKYFMALSWAICVRTSRRAAERSNAPSIEVWQNLTEILQLKNLPLANVDSSKSNIYQSFQHYQSPDRKSGRLQRNLACQQPVNTRLLRAHPFSRELFWPAAEPALSTVGLKGGSYPSFRLENPCAKRLSLAFLSNSCIQEDLDPWPFLLKPSDSGISIFRPFHCF